MKYLLLFLFVPAIALAQAPNQGQMLRQAAFEQIKERMGQMMISTIPAMEKTQTCLQQASDKADLNGCVEIMAAVQQKVMSKMAAGHGAQKMPPRPDIEWSEELKTKMLKDLDRVLVDSKVTQGCLGSSSSPEQMDACMAKAGLGR